MIIIIVITIHGGSSAEGEGLLRTSAVPPQAHRADRHITAFCVVV